MLLFVVVVEAQSVVGQVIDSKTQETIIGATISVVDDKNVSAVTDVNGQFSLPARYQGKQVKISYIGYKPLAVALGLMPLTACIKMSHLLAR